MPLQKGDKLSFICNCSFLEIYNERVFDLLDAASTGLQLREDVKHGVIVQDITEVPVETPQEAMEVTGIVLSSIELIFLAKGVESRWSQPACCRDVNEP